ncbi:M23 family metallopeptidase [Massilia oculi]|uniref:M23 family metallopeptidase n=1 Tax=Massilia hydrophila TaxID=3044279 RepID=A0ABS7Y9I1_9BURK|nr:M23 family metallopeptidase [Massilia oculi]MCA1856349.1 M23 family metallopeptidase [Massilia oculi]
MQGVQWPLDYNIIRGRKLSNTYGRFKERFAGCHWGWDFYAGVGTPCYAIADAISIQTYQSSSFGLVLVLEFDHEGRRLFAAYCHLDKAIVQGAGPRNQIKAGDFVAYTGSSGNASNLKGEEEHLHFELRTSVRPLPGEKGRLSPIEIFRKCPLNSPIITPHRTSEMPKRQGMVA